MCILADNISGHITSHLTVMAAILDFAFDQHVPYLKILTCFFVANETIFNKKVSYVANRPILCHFNRKYDHLVVYSCSLFSSNSKQVIP